MFTVPCPERALAKGRQAPQKGQTDLDLDVSTTDPRWGAASRSCSGGGEGWGGRGVGG